MPATGGVAACLRLIEAHQRAAGHEVFRFGCAFRAAEAGVFPRFVDFAGRRSPRDIFRLIHNTDAANKLDRFLRDTSIDVAHLHNIYNHLTPSILPVLARRRVGVVMTVHDYRLACPTKHFARPDGLCTRCLPNKFHHAASPRCAGLAGAPLAVESLVQRLFRRYYGPVDVFICPTLFVRDVLIRAGVPRSKAVLVRNPVSFIALPAGVKQRGDELLYVGRVSDEKRPQMMLAVAEKLPDARVVIAGDGPLRSCLESEATEHGLTNVKFLGHVGHESIARHLASAAAVVLTSRCMENSPGAMLEAMAARRCVIVPDQPPLREWVEDGRTGRTFAPGDEQSLVKVAGEVLADPRGRARMAKAAAELIAGRHGSEAVAAAMEQCYRESISRCALR